MKKVKKLLAMIMAMTMVLGLGLTSFAANPGADTVYGTSDDRGTISVEGIVDESDDNLDFEVVAYQIVEAKYNTTTGVFEGYNSLYPQLSIEPEADGTTIEFEQSELDAVRNAIAADPSVTEYEMTYENGVFKNTDVPVGSYLVVVKNAESKVYNSVVTSVYYTVTEGNNDLEETTLDITEEPAWVKVTDKPDVDKEVVNGDDAEPSKGNSANVGDVLDYTVTINPIPYYGGKHPVLTVTDILSTGLTYVADSLKVEINGTTLSAGTDYTFNVTGQTIEVNFVVNNEYQLNDYVGQKAVISYQAKVNTNAVINEGGNGNDVTLDYSVDSTTEDGEKTDDDQTYTYTFDINGSVSGEDKVITKVGEGTDVDALGGATFTLYKDEACTQTYTNDIFSGTATSDAEGQLEIKGLAEGTYYLKETAAPEGYTVNEHVFTIVIDAEYDEEPGSPTEGQLKKWTITIDGEATSTFTVENEGGAITVDEDVASTEIKNTKIASLPSTGGIGTTIFTIGGCAIMIAAAALFFVSRRKSEEN